MADAPGDKRDFFVSYANADEQWAEWLAWIVEEAGWSVWLQKWDFRGSFVLQMDRATDLSERTIGVLSAAALASAQVQAEWDARRAVDPRNERESLILVKIGACEAPGLLKPFVWLDVAGAGPDAGRVKLVEWLARQRRKPGSAPPAPPGPSRPKPREEPRPAFALNNLPHANPDFVGREAALAELRGLLTSGPGPAVLTQAITGLGGIGKTQTALAYAYRHLADYDLVWWLHAETQATLAADYAGLAAPLGLDSEMPDQAQLTAAIRARLQATPSWLLVFDNVEDPALPGEWLPATGGGHALLTSRRTDWRGRARVLPLELMPEAEALQLLAGRPDPEALPAAELAAAKELAAELGLLPLALAQARAYMAETGKSHAGYLRLFRESRPADLAAERPSPDYPASYATTSTISIGAAAAACPAARPLLELLAFLGADPLPAEVLGADRAALPEGLRGERERDAAVAALRRYSLVGVKAGALTMHRLVQVVARGGLAEPTAKHRAEVAVRLIEAALPNSPQDHVSWLPCAALLPHALAASHWAERLGTQLDAAGRVLNQMSLYLQARAAWAEAEPLLRRAVAMGEATLGPQHPSVATRLNNLAGLYQDTGRYADAEPLYKRAIAIDETVLGREHPGLATDLNNLAELYVTTCRYAEAEPLYRRAVAILEATLPPNHPTLIAVRGNHAALLEHLRDTGGAA